MKLWKRILLIGMIFCISVSGTGWAADLPNEDELTVELEGSGDTTIDVGNDSEDLEISVQEPEDETQEIQQIETEPGEVAEQSGEGQRETELDVKDKSERAVMQEAEEIPILTQSTKVSKGKKLRILAIGNSFTDDTMRYVYSVAKSAGYDLTVGVLWLSSMDLEDHLDFFENNRPEYNYDKFAKGLSSLPVEKENVRPNKVLTEEKWDLVFLQQQSYLNGDPDSFFDEAGNSYLTAMSDYIRGKVDNPDLSMAWLMSWAYAKRYNNFTYEVMYHSSQTAMYRALVKTMRSSVWATGLFEMIIPVGTTIQNIRSSYTGDTLNRDGRHLTYGLGRYAAALTVARSIGIDLNHVTYYPDGVSLLHFPMLKQAITNAVNDPFTTTKSTYSKRPSGARAVISKRSSQKRSVKIEWPAVKGTTKYRVYRRTKSDGKWSKVKQIKQSAKKTYSFTDKQVKNGKRYYYRVDTLFDEYIHTTRSKDTAIVHLQALSDVKVISKKKKQLFVSWNKNQSASKYEIRLATDRSMKNAKKFSAKSSLENRTISGLRSKQKYYVQVRCCNEKGYTSGWSDTLTCTVK